MLLRDVERVPELSHGGERLGELTARHDDSREEEATRAGRRRRRNRRYVKTLCVHQQSACLLHIMIYSS